MRRQRPRCRDLRIDAVALLLQEADQPDLRRHIGVCSLQQGLASGVSAWGRAKNA
jgi:hypothetical protein